MQTTVKVSTKDIDFYYGSNQALFNVSLDFPANQVTALIGPSGCGKSTYLRCLNRMNDLIPGTRCEGEILLDGEPVDLKKHNVAYIFQEYSTMPWLTVEKS